ncbi:MAG: preprotein translocase subunit SecF [Blastocatellia bacterium]|jgi:preprotein translocase subunit SecF|nr:preprotein translocase subunit SecF [Blastocatellia bacterium]
MLQLFHDINIDWLGKRRIFIGISIVLMLAGMGTALYRHKVHPNGTEAFNLGVDFKGGTVITVRFKQPPPVDSLRASINQAGIKDAVIQPVLDKPGEFLIKVPHQGFEESATGENQAGVDAARTKIRQAINTFGSEAEAAKSLEEDPKAAYKIEGTDAVGQVASKQLRNQAVAVTIAALVGMLLFIAFRFEWTYGAAAVIAVFHTVLVTLGLFAIFQIEINLTVIAALLTLVGFDVNDSIVIFDRIRENRKLYRRMNLYDVTNLSINQTLSRTVITSGLVFLSVVALVLLGGETLRPFSLALLMGIIFGTYDTIAVAGPIMVWWEKKIAAANKAPATNARDVSVKSSRGASRAERTRDGVGKPSQAA